MMDVPAGEQRAREPAVELNIKKKKELNSIYNLYLYCLPPHGGVRHYKATTERQIVAVEN